MHRGLFVGKGGFGLGIHFYLVTIPGMGGAVTSSRKLPCALSAAARRGSLREGAVIAGD